MLDNVGGSQLDLFLPDAAASDALGAALANALPEATARTGAVLHLNGELGAGKTTCARSLLRTLGITGLVRSPTYTLLETYVLADFTCVHVDLYRLQGARDVDELDLRGYLGTPSLLLIEWAERGGAAVSRADLDVILDYAGDARHATLKSGSELGQYWLRDLAKDASLVSYVSNLT